VLAAGYAFVQQRATQFVDEARRSRFLGALPAHRELLTAWCARSEWTEGEPAANTGDAPRPNDLGRRAQSMACGQNAAE